MKKRIFAIIIIVVLIVSVTPQKGDAFAPAIAIEGVKVIVMALLTALGVTALSDDALVAAVNGFIGDLTAGAQQLIESVDFKVYTGSFTNPAFGNYIGPAGWLTIPPDLWEYAKSYVDAEYNEGINIVYNDLTEITLDNGDTFNIWDSQERILHVNEITMVDHSGIIHRIILEPMEGLIDHASYSVYNSDGELILASDALKVWLEKVEVYGDYDYVLRFKTFGDSYHDYNLQKIDGYVYIGSLTQSEILGKEGYIDDPGRDWDVTDEDGNPLIPYIPNIGLIGRAIGQLIDSDYMKDRYVGLDVDDLPKTIEGVEITEENIEDIATEDFFEWEEGIEEGTSLKALFFSKFPFCLPWDIKNLFTVLAAPAEAPNFEVDIYESVRDDYGITGDTTIRFNMGEYEILGKVSRITALIGFILVLIMITRKIIRS